MADVYDVAKAYSRIEYEDEVWDVVEYRWWCGSGSKFRLMRPKRNTEICHCCYESYYIRPACEHRMIHQDLTAALGQCWKRDKRGIFYMCETKRQWHVVYVPTGRLIGSGYSTYDVAESAAKECAKRDRGKTFQIVMTCALVTAQDVVVEKLV